MFVYTLKLDIMLNCETELTSAGKKYFQNIEENA
mgnify:CR=1 FL=1